MAMQGGMFGRNQGITSLYQNYLKRDPTQDDLNYWGAEGEGPLSSIESNIRAGSEYQGINNAAKAGGQSSAALYSDQLFDGNNLIGTTPASRSWRDETTSRSPRASLETQPTVFGSQPAAAQPDNPLLAAMNQTTSAPGWATATADSALGQQYRNQLNDYIYGVGSSGIAPSFSEGLTSIYQNQLGRAPDAAGAASWLKDFNSGQTLQQIEQNINIGNEAAGKQNVYQDQAAFLNNDYTKQAAALRGLAQMGLPTLPGATMGSNNAPYDATRPLDVSSSLAPAAMQGGMFGSQPAARTASPARNPDGSALPAYYYTGGDNFAGLPAMDGGVDPRLRTAQPAQTTQPAAIQRTGGGAATDLPSMRYAPAASRPVSYGLDFSNLGNPNIERQRVEDVIMGRLNPQLDRDRAALETRLVNQGLVQGSEAFNTAMDQANRAANEARVSAILSGGQEQSRLFGLALAQAQNNNQVQAQEYGQNLSDTAFNNQAIGQDFAQALNEGQFDQSAQGQEFAQWLANAQLNNSTGAQQFNQNLSAANFNNTQRQNAINEALMERQIPLNEIIALMGGSQVQQPNFVNTPSTPLGGTDVAGNIYANYEGALNQYNQKLASRNAMVGGLFGLAGTLGGAGLMGGMGGMGGGFLNRNMLGG